MIEFGMIRIRDSASIVEARKKIHRFAQAIRFDEITSTRIAVAASVQCRRMLQQGDDQGPVRPGHVVNG